MKYCIPRDETVCVRFPSVLGEDVFLITTKQMTGLYYLYEIKDGTANKLGKSINPLELEEKFNVMGRIESLNKSITKSE